MQEVRTTLEELVNSKGGLAKALKEFNKFLPKNCEITLGKDGVSYSFVDKKIDYVLGAISIDKEGFVELAIYREGIDTQITGQQIFNSLIQKLKIDKIEYNGFRGIWGETSTNTKMFNESMLGKLATEENLKKAAFDTWTGQRVTEQRIDKVKIDKLIPEDGPPFTKINVTFYK